MFSGKIRRDEAVIGIVIRVIPLICDKMNKRKHALISRAIEDGKSSFELHELILNENRLLGFMEQQLMKSISLFLDTVYLKEMHQKRPSTTHLCFYVIEAGWFRNERSGGCIWIEEKTTSEWSYTDQSLKFLRGNLCQEVIKDHILEALSTLYLEARRINIVPLLPREFDGIAWDGRIQDVRKFGEGFFNFEEDYESNITIF